MSLFICEEEGLSLTPTHNPHLTLYLTEKKTDLDLLSSNTYLLRPTLYQALLDTVVNKVPIIMYIIPVGEIYSVPDDGK